MGLSCLQLWSYGTKTFNGFLYINYILGKTIFYNRKIKRIKLIVWVVCKTINNNVYIFHIFLYFFFHSEVYYYPHNL